MAVVCVLASGCGIQMRPRTVTAPAAAASAPTTSTRPNPILAHPSEDGLVLAPGQTVVSITFDDGRASNLSAARMLTAHGLNGTFFINSANIGKTGYLTLADLDSMAVTNHEIGGHTLTHPDLDSLSLQDVRAQVCDDRNTLIGWGYPVRSFAYPFA